MHDIYRELSETLVRLVATNQYFLERFSHFVRANKIDLQLPTDSQLDGLRSNCSSFGREMRIACRCFASLAALNGWPTYGVWRRQAILSELHLRSISLKQLIESQAAIGLPQNKLSAHGTIRPYEYVDRPNSSVTALDGFNLTTEGDVVHIVEVVGPQEPGKPALITLDDLRVALCLAFCEPGLDLKAGISLELPSDNGVAARTSCLLYKEFTPPWLAPTDFGGSLYCADLMAARFDDRRGVGSFTDPLLVDVSDLANFVRGHFDRYGAEHAAYATDSSRICLSLYSVNALRDEMPNGDGNGRSKYFLKFRDIGFRIDGSGMNYFRGGRDIAYENDPSRPEARLGLSLTNRLARLEAAFPVFRRVKYLMAMTRLFIEEKRRGMRLDEGLLDELETLRQSLIQRTKSMCLFVAPQ